MQSYGMIPFVVDEAPPPFRWSDDLKKLDECCTEREVFTVDFCPIVDKYKAVWWWYWWRSSLKVEDSNYIRYTVYVGKVRDKHTSLLTKLICNYHN